MTNKGFSMSAFIAFGNGCINNVNGNTPDIQSAFKTDLKKAIAHAGYPSKDEIGIVDEINDFSMDNTLGAIPDIVSKFMHDEQRSFDIPAADDNSEGKFSLGQKVKVTAYFSNSTASGTKVTRTKNLVIKKILAGAKHPYLVYSGNTAIGWTEEQYMSATTASTTDTYVYHTGIAIESKPGIGVFACARSSNCATQSYLPNGFGIIDTATYRGEILFKYKLRTAIGVRDKNLADSIYRELPWYIRLFTKYDEILNSTIDEVDPMTFAPYKVGDKIGQIFAMKIPTMVCKQVDELSKTERGTGGFGSTNENQ